MDKHRDIIGLIVVIASLWVWGCDEPRTITEDTPAACQDHGDNDSDGLIDCEDPDCSAFDICIVTDADADADGDGDTDADIDGDSDSDGDGDGDGDGDADADADDDADGPVDPRFDPLIESLEDQLYFFHVPGMAVAVIEGGEVTFAAGFGSRHPDEDIPVEATTLFRLGSVTKMLTAATLLQLVEDGLVVLSSPITDYLPDFEFALDPTWASSITIQHLLTHTSGIVDYIEIDSDRDASALSSFFNETFGSFAYLMAPPGRMWNYTNPGYMLAGLVTETVSDTYYHEHMEANLFTPLGMNRTFFLPDDVIDDGDYAVGETTHWETGTRMLAEPDTYDSAWCRPAGYAYSSVLDMARFILFLRDGAPDVLGDAERMAMLSPQVNMEDFLDYEHYGYGLMVLEGGFYSPAGDEFYEMRILRHNGAINGFSADLYYVPDLDFGFITLANGDGAYFTESFYTALHTLCDMPAPVTPPDLTMTTEELETLVGDYRDPFNMGDVSISLVSGNVRVDMPDVDAAGVPYDRLLEPFSPWNFILTIQGYPAVLTFIGDDEGNAEYIRTRFFVAERVAPEEPPGPPPLPPSLENIERMLQTLRQLPPPSIPVL